MDPVPTSHSTTGETLCAHVTTNEQINMPESSMLTSDQQEQLEPLILDSANIFSLTHSDLGYTSIVQHTIDTDDNQPIKQQPQRMPFIRRQRHRTAFN